MAKPMINVAILGSTGSIGQSTIDVVEASAGQLKVVAITAHSSLAVAVEQARRLKPHWLVATDEDEARDFDWSGLPEATRLLVGTEDLREVLASDEVDVVVSAIVGSAGLQGTWYALEAGKRVALANKETLVLAGPLVMRLCEQHGGEIIPVDSEHSAVFQTLAAGCPSEVSRVILTASGGPFLRHTARQMAQVSVRDALAHPTWKMGNKISIDSATMMNKALEIIEARWLFGLRPEQIDVVIHPQSIVHSMVEYKDGAVVAQLSIPDMRLPIQYALTYPHRWESPVAKMDWAKAMRLEFEPPDLDRFPALALGHEVAKAGGTAGAVLNAANEAAVQGFMDGQLEFTEIVPACRSILDQHEFDPLPSLEQLMRLDGWARQEVSKWVCT